MKNRWIQTILLSAMAFALILGAENLEIHAKTETLLSDQPVAMAAGSEDKQTESEETEDISDETAEMAETETMETEMDETVESPRFLIMSMYVLCPIRIVILLERFTMEQLPRCFLLQAVTMTGFRLFLEM